MSVKVELKFTKGGLKDKVFTYDQKECVIIGRQDDCNIVVPATDITVSRYHCILDITPPSVTVRDFGSLNGTFLNDKKIGQGDLAKSAEERRETKSTEFPLKQGDRLGLSRDCELVMDVLLPQYCAGCFCEIDKPEFTNAEQQPVCADCHTEAEKRKIEEKDEAIKKREQEEKEREIALQNRNNPKCKICGAAVSVNSPAICSTCRANPMKFMEFLIKNALEGESGAQQIAGYRNIKMLGKGGMGAVWLVEEIATGKQMAMKLMLPTAAADKKAKALFLREAYNACQLSHKNIVQHSKCGCSGDIYFILLDYCAGGSVDDLIKRNPAIFWGNVSMMKQRIKISTEIILQTLDGLEYAHHAPVVVKLADGSQTTVNGLVHRDFKPGNIFLSSTSLSPVAKVADFGLAKAFQTAGLTTSTITGDAAGTPMFMPRQQLINYRYAKPDVDVWAAAAAYYYMLTGFAPKDFSGKDMCLVVISENHVPIRKRNPHIDKKLADVIDTALMDRPTIGFATARELKKAILSVT